MREYTYTLKKEDEETPLKDLLRKKFDFSSRLRTKIKRERLVFLNGEEPVMWSCGKAGDVLSVRMPEERSGFEPEDIPVDVIYEDDDILVINKHPGYICHPTKGHVSHTMANGIMKYMIDSGQSFKIRFINRLDMDTSGILLIAKNAHAQADFMKKAKHAEKIYAAIVDGSVEEDEGVIDEPVGQPDPEKVERGVVPEELGGQPSVSHYKVEERFRCLTKGGETKDYSLVKVLIKTGRTHQIRVHMAHIGHPVVGDHLYGEENPFLIERHALHAEELSFDHPATGERLHFEAAWPEDMKRLLDILREGAKKYEQNRQ
ncbi:MAG: RluA family pseudouridine synthase [Firmicutes bacterium]|nr:RluA family pseudouridine synthase [Bacillota bacterium]